MKRTPLRRRTPLRPGKPIRQRSPKKRDRGELDDPAYLEWLRKQLCRAPGIPPHPGQDPHHPRHDEQGNAIGARLKSHDHCAVSLCRRCHRHIHSLTGPFRGWTRADVHAWMDKTAAEQRAQYLGAQAGTEVDPLRFGL